jgi:2-iminobutanoate/2-iminopropanoate deaminase
MDKETIYTEGASPPVGPYSQAVRCGRFIFLAGQIPIEAATGNVGTGDIARQTEMVLQNIRSVLSATGVTLADIVKTTLFIKNMVDFPVINKVYNKAFPQSPPARSCVEVAALPKGIGIQIEAIAYLPEQ